MNKNIDNFANKAKDWDAKPERVKLALSIAAKIKEKVKLSDSMQALDFGCGTGLISFPLASELAHIQGLDLSSEMVKIFNQKAKEQNIANCNAAAYEGTQDFLTKNKYDLVFSGMVFHHIENVRELLNKLSFSLKLGALICIADLDKEDGSFHSDNTGVYHFGFERSNISSLLVEAGFSKPLFYEPYIINKQNKNYPVFLAVAKKE